MNRLEYRWEYRSFTTQTLMETLDAIGKKSWEAFQIEEIKAPNPATPDQWYRIYAKRVLP